MLRWLWLAVVLIFFYSLPLSNSVQQEQAFVPIGPCSGKDKHPTQSPLQLVKQHSDNHWKPLNCTPSKDKADLLVQKGQNGLEALVSSPFFKHLDVESCQEFRVVEVKVDEQGLNLENGQERIKESFHILERFLDSSGANKHLDKMIFLHVYLPSSSEEEQLKVTIGVPISEKVEKLIQEKNKNPNITLVTYPAKTRVGLEIHHDFPLLGHVSRTRKIMDTRIVFMGAKALENVLNDAGLQPEKSSFYFVSHSGLKKVGLKENEIWIDLQ